jgi:hypothetical protein
MFSSKAIIMLASLFLIFVIGQNLALVRSLPPIPPDHLQPERAWIKEEGLPANAWGQYNDTGPNKLNLTYRHSSVNLGYVIRSSDPADDLNATFIIYKNSTALDGFNSTGHLAPGATPIWSLLLPLSSEQTVGEFIYHTYIATYDPEGSPGLYQVRINLSGTIIGGSNWLQPDGNPNAPWMFFEVPVGSSWPVSVSDHLGRFTPFFFDTPIPSTSLNATFSVRPPGNLTGAQTARALWNHTNGTMIYEREVPVYFAGDGRWAAQSIVPANASIFPPNATHPYNVAMTIGVYTQYADFHVYPLHAAIPPDTWLTQKPPAVTENTTAQFEWIGSDIDGSVTAYHFRIDSGSWATTQDTSRTYPGLSNGTHKFEVRAEDDDGIVDPSPATHFFTILINSPPDTELVTVPNATTRLRDLFFEGNGSDSDGTVASYDYRMDSEPWVNTVATNATYINLSSGDHTFQARSRDNRGLEDPSPATIVFLILPSWCEAELETLLATVAALEQRVADLDEVIANLTSLLEASEGENSLLSALVEDLEEERTGLVSLIDHLGQEKMELLSRVASLTSENEELQGLFDGCLDLTISLKDEVDQLNETVSALLRENRELGVANDYLLGLVEQLREKIRRLESEVPELGIESFIWLGVLVPFGRGASRLLRGHL